MAEENKKSHEYESSVATEGAVESKDRGLFDFMGKKKEEKPQDQDQVIATEFEKVHVSEHKKEEEEEEKKPGLLEKLHRSNSSSSSKMSQGRVRAKCATLVAAVPLCLLLVYALNVDAATYTVGDSAGWSFKVASWPKGKRFRAGDTLIFKYDPTLHNVVPVNRASYKSCTTAAGAKVYSSGNDSIKLVKGQNFFVCNTAGHCGSGMKIAINAM